MTDDEDEPCAEINYDFILSGIRISGSTVFSTRTKAFQICNKLNEMYGENTHYVTVKNITYKEWLETFK